MTTQPLVSTLVPIYNVRQYLPQMVDSLRKQTYRNHEVILVDDCSTDDGYAYLKEVVRRDTRFRVYANEENLGPSATINKAASYARGTLLARLDADDTAVPERLERQVSFLLDHPEVDFVGSDFRQVDASGRRRKTVRATIRDGAALKALMLFVNTFCHSTVMYRRTIFEQVGGYNETLRAALDYDLLARLSAAGNGHILPDPLINYRMHAANISTKQFLLQRENAAAVQVRLLEHYGFTFDEQALKTHQQATIFAALPAYRVDLKSLLRIRSWLLELREQNEGLGTFPPEEFDRVLEKIHNGIFTRKNSSISLSDYLQNLTGDFSSHKPANLLLHLLHSLKNGW